MTRQIIIVFAWLLATASPTLAHSFNVVMVVPDQVSPDVHRDMCLAFLVASEERDAHANQESDGHLGGLDVYITIAGLGARDRINAANPDILSLPLRGDATFDDAVTFGPLNTTSPKAVAFLARPAAPGLAPFAQRFAARTGQAPGPEATAAYLAARQIGVAVRALGGVGDRATLAQLLQGD